jgi:CheY-like chemotaxis protein
MTHAEHANTSPRNQGNTIHKVLVVDDVASIAKELKAALSADKFQVVGAEGINDGLRRLEEEPLPTVIVIDIYIPNDGGLYAGARLARKIREKTKLIAMRQRLKLLEIPIIAYSNYIYWIKQKKTTDEEYAQVQSELHKYGIYDFIDKNMTEGGDPNPDSINTLATRIRQIVAELERGERK